MDELLLKIGQINNSATASYVLVLERVLKTCVEMLKDRSLTVLNECRTIGDITYKMQEGDPILYGEQWNVESSVVIFHSEERIGVKQMRGWHEKYPDANVIIVSLEGPTAFTRKEAEQYYKHFQFFSFKQLCINITKHLLVPTHERLNAEECKTSNIDIQATEKWPKLFTNDAVAQYYDFKPGDLIRIVRTVGYAEPVFFYRRVYAPVVT